MLDELEALRAENAKLRAVIATHDLCHDSDLSVGEPQFHKSCVALIRREFGKCTMADHLAALLDAADYVVRANEPIDDDTPDCYHILKAAVAAAKEKP